MVPLSSLAKGGKTVDLSAHRPLDRFAFWNEVILENFAPSDNLCGVRSQDFRASIQHRVLGGVEISRIDSVPITSIRDARGLRLRPRDCFFLSLLTEGAAQLRQGGRCAIQGAGDFVLYDSARPFHYEITSNYSGVWLRIPRRLVMSRLANAEAMTARSTSTHSPLGALVATLLREASLMDLDAHPQAAARVAASLIDIVAAAMETSTGLDSSDSSRNVNLLDSAKSLMTANLDDPDFCVDSMVDVLATSRRTLNRVFAKEGTSPIRWLWKKRLERSRSLLENSKDSRITDVALSCGFSDFSHFSRAFKLEFGMTPTSVISIAR